MKILFITNLPSPYRVDFFNELSKNCELTVCYERKQASDRDTKWKAEPALGFEEVYSDNIPFSTDQSIGNSIINIIKNKKVDRLIFSNYASPGIIVAIWYCIIKKIPYYIEYDGAFNIKDSCIKKVIKYSILKKAKGHFTTCKEHINYLKSFNIKEKNIFKYPFSSLREKDILLHPIDNIKKIEIREELNISEEKIILSVGQFIYRKGFDVLLNATTKIDKSIGIYIIGGKPTDEYKDIVKKNKLSNVHFIEFQEKRILEKWYRATDLFVFPTREDIWGLVINEAMANGLPVITTNRCIAGLELIENGVNGYIVETNDVDTLVSKIDEIIYNTTALDRMGNESLKVIRNYTIENMVSVHMEYLKNERTY